jgi:RimJ/RimL family protein N-acetyltransferase
MKVVCKEPEGPVEREVWPFVFNRENIFKLYKAASQFPVLFDGAVGTMENFLSRFLVENLSGDIEPAGLIWVIDDFVGIVYMNNISLEEADVHYSFFDRRHKGRETLVSAMLKYAFNKYRFTRLNAQIPAYAGLGPRIFAERCGFRLEGRKRKAVWYKGEKFDVYLYGILAEEVNGRQD